MAEPGYQSRVDAEVSYSRKSHGHGSAPDADGTHRHRAHRRGRARGCVRRCAGESGTARCRPDAPRDAEPAPAHPGDRQAGVRRSRQGGLAHHGQHRDARRRGDRRRDQGVRDVSRVALRDHRIPLGEGAVEGPRLARRARRPGRASRRSPSPAATSSSSGVPRRPGPSRASSAHRRSMASAISCSRPTDCCHPSRPAPACPWSSSRPRPPSRAPHPRRRRSDLQPGSDPKLTASLRPAGRTLWP